MALPDDRVAVLGSALGEIAPDRIEWTLVVRELDADPRAAFDRCAQRLHALAAALTVAEVTTGAVAVSPERTREREPTGRHEARGALTAVAPLELGGEVAGAAMEAGADELQGPTLRTPDTGDLQDALLAEAVQAARRRAERVAAAAGRRLGRVLSVRDARLGYDEEPMAFGELMSRGDGSSGGPPVIPRPQQLAAGASVVFELLD